MGSSKAQTANCFKKGPCNGPVASFEQMFTQLEFCERRIFTVGEPERHENTNEENVTGEDYEWYSVESLSWKRWANEISAGGNKKEEKPRDQE